MLGAIVTQSHAHQYGYGYPNQGPPPQQQPSAVQQCPDGSTIPAGNYCPAPAQAPQSYPPHQGTGERG
jgi:hypothetical protein